MEIPNSSNTIDQRWEADYEGPCVQEFGPLNHEFQVIMRDDTRVECKLTTQQLKSWQVWIACQSTVFELAKRIVVNNDYDNVVRMTRVLTAHYKNLIKKRFPANIQRQFRQTVTAEGRRKKLQ